MSFVSKNLQSKQGGLTFIKGATLFFLGMSAVLFLTQAFDIVPSVTNRAQLIKEVLFTADGSQSGNTGAYIDGSGGNAYFAGTVTGTTVNGTTVNGTTVNGTTVNATTVCLTTDGSVPGGCRDTWPTGGTAGSGATPGGVTTNIQFNDTDTFSGEDRLVRDMTYGRLGVNTSSPANTLDVRGEASIGINNIVNVGIAPISQYSSILGGEGNNLQAGINSTIVGGINNTVNRSSCHGSPCTSYYASRESSIGGGSGNSLQGSYSNIVGGLSNTIYLHNKSVIVGGENNTIDAPAGTYSIDGYETIINGRGNEIINSPYSMIAGGISGNISNHQGVFLRSDSVSSGFSAQKEDTFLIKATNGVGIGTNNPTEQLEVAGNIKLTGSGTLSATSPASSQIYLGTNGNVGIGATASSTRKLLVAGNVEAVGYYYTSDKKLKKDITQIRSALDKILSLNGYFFSWKNNGKKSVGVIAQEVEKVFPELIGTDDKGYKSVEYGNLVAPLIEAIKELNAKVDMQAKEIQSLKEIIIR